MNARDLDDHITGHHGADQMRVFCEQCGKKVKDEDAFQIVYSGASYPFCSGKCLSDYAKDNL